MRIENVAPTADEHGASPSSPGADRHAQNADRQIARMKSNYAIFDSYVAKAQKSLEQGNLETAGGYALMGAWVAAHMHCGFFASPRIERILNKIGRQIPSSLPTTDRAGRPEQVKRVLHVSGEITAVGGLATMLRRWIESDPGREHSVALTQQYDQPSALITAAVSRAGGSIHLLSRAGGLAAKVTKLRQLASEHDLIVLHIPNSDVVAPIAFAEPKRFPPVLFLNHSDHMFWIGSTISQVVGSMRKAALDICEKRRYVEKKRSVLLPILVSPTARTKDREAAKAALGLDPSALLLISVARAQKYRTISGVSYADTHSELLKRFPNALLMVVGGGERPDWADASAAVGGRIQSLTPRDPKPYFEAADIYLDSFPFCSATSMMEAAGYGLPCVSRFVLPPEARICGMDHPGLAGPLVESTNDQDYIASLERLMSDPKLRARIGEATEKSVLDANVSPGWNKYLEAAVARALELPPVDLEAILSGDFTEKLNFGEPDTRLEDIYGFAPPQAAILRHHLGLFPLSERLKLWIDVARARAFLGWKDAVKGLFRESLVFKLKDTRAVALSVWRPSQ